MLSAQRLLKLCFNGLLCYFKVIQIPRFYGNFSFYFIFTSLKAFRASSKSSTTSTLFLGLGLWEATPSILCQRNSNLFNAFGRVYPWSGLYLFTKEKVVFCAGSFNNFMGTGYPTKKRFSDFPAFKSSSTWALDGIHYSQRAGTQLAPILQYFKLMINVH